MKTWLDSKDIEGVNEEKGEGCSPGIYTKEHQNGPRHINDNWIFLQSADVSDSYSDAPYILDTSVSRSSNDLLALSTLTCLSISLLP